MTLLSRAPRRVGLVVGAALGLVLVAVPAAAHTELIGSTPEDKATMATAPAQVVLEFYQPVQQDFGQVAVLDAAGAHHEQGDSEIDGSIVTQHLAPLDAGAYEISYRVNASDGHPITGSLTFTVAETETSEPTPQTSPGSVAPNPSPSDEAMPHDSSTSPTSDPVDAADADGGTSPLLLGAGGLAAAAAVAAVVFFAMGGRGPRESEGGEESETEL